MRTDVVLESIVYVCTGLSRFKLQLIVGEGACRRGECGMLYSITKYTLSVLDMCQNCVPRYKNMAVRSC